MTIDTLIVLAGIGQLTLLIAAAQVPARLHWRTELQPLPRVHRQMHWVYGGYVTLSMLSVAAIALLLSTMTDSAIAAALGTIGFLIASTVLLGLDAAHSIRPYLPTRYWLSFVDLFRDPIRWEGVVRGVLGQLAYLLVFLTAAWANFASKDINS